MAFDPTMGTEGRVRIGASSTVIAGIQSWKINKNVAEIPANHFELSADSDSIVWTEWYKGLAGATIDLEGMYNVDATEKTEGGTPGLYVGATVSIDLLFSRTPFGYLDVAGFVTSLSAGTQVENKMATFQASIRCSGAVGKGA